MEYIDLVKQAVKAKEFAYTPYYKFRVGAALLTKSGNVYTGCNVENGAGFSICAERAAAVKAISVGDKDFVAIAITTDEKKFVYPCGVCRQFLVEFNPNLDVILFDGKILKTEKLTNLLPNFFN
jgi:cytidine deaminase